MRLDLLALVTALAPCLGFAGPAPARGPAAPCQDERVAEERALARFGDYLARKPFHEQGFERYFEAAVALNQLPQIISDLETRLEAGAAGAPERVLLARLYARTERAPRALEVLDAVRAAPEAAAYEGDLRRLRGEWLIATGEVEPGLAELDAAAALRQQSSAAGGGPGVAFDTRALEALHGLRAEAALRLGDRARAASALADLALVDPASFDLALDVAERLERASLFDEARARYDEALRIAGDDDAPRRCRALTALGGLHERRGDAAAAVAAYGAAFDLLGRGHWLKRELEARLLGVHTRAGTLAAFAGELQARIDARRDDLDRRVLLARVQRAQRDLPAARATLDAAIVDFPADLALGREQLGVLALLKDDEGRVALMQRLIGEHPDELELYIELGQVLAQGGRLEQARLQWQRTLEGRLSDAGLCLRLAALHAHNGLFAEAVELVERALALEPRELAHYDELARILVVANRRSEVAGVLDRAEAAAGEDATRLETLASIAGGFRDAERAGRALERALAVAPRVDGAPREPRLLRALAEHARATGDPTRAAALMREVVATAPDAAVAGDAARRLLRLRRSDLTAFEREEAERLAVDPAEPAARFLAALVAYERRRYPDALAHLEQLLALDPTHEPASVLAAQLHERLGDDDAAVARYRTLMEARPRQRARWLGELGRLHVRLDDDAAAILCFEESLELSPDNPATFREVARAFESLGEHTRARAALRQVLRLRPDDGEARLELADLLLVASADEEPEGPLQAEELVAQVAVSTDTALVQRARRWLYERLDERGEVDAEIARQRAELERNPFDDARPLALVDLFVREREYELALELLDGLLVYRPGDVALLRERAGLFYEMRRFEAALEDYATLLRLPGVDRDALLLRVADCRFEQGDAGGADDALAQVGDRLRAVALYRQHGRLDQALALLDDELARAPEDRALLERLSSLHQERRDFAAASAAFERLAALEGESSALALRRALLWRDAGDRAAYADALVKAVLAGEPAVGPAGDAARSLAKGPRRALRDELARERREVFAVRTEVQRGDDWQLWTEVIARATEAPPVRAVLFNAAFPALLGDNRYDEAAALLETARAELDAGRCPVGYSTESWQRLLGNRERQLRREDPVRAAARAEELTQAVAGDAEALTTERINELATYHRDRGDSAALLELYEAAAERFPRETRYGAAVAALLIEQGDTEGVVTALRALLDAGRLSAATDPLRPNRKDRERLEERLPEALRPHLTEAHVERHRKLTARAGIDGEWSVGQRPRREDVELALASALVELDERGEARALLAALEPADPEHVRRALFLAAVYTELGFDADAERLQSETRAALLAAGEDALLASLVHVDPEARALVAEWGAALFERGEDARGYELARRWGGPEHAARLRAQRADLAPLVAAFDERWRAARATASEASGAHFVRDTGVLLVELLVHQHDWPGVVAVAEELARANPTDVELALFAARAQRRNGDPEAARRTLENAVSVALAAVRATGKIPPNVGFDFNDEPAPLPVAGLMPAGLDGRGTNAIGFLSQLEMALAFSPVSDLDKWLPWTIEIELVEGDWADARWTAVAERLRRMFAATPGAPSWVQEQLIRATAHLTPGADTLPLLELAYDISGDDVDAVLRYGAALEAVDRSGDALRLYRKFARAAGPDADHLAALEERIARLDPEGARAAALPEDLAAAVAADPKSVRLRRAWVERLLELCRYDEAVVEALALEALAPHLQEVAALCADALLIAGRDAEYAARERKRLAAVQDADERFMLALRVATVLYEVGDRAGAEEALRAARAGGGTSEYTAAAFWLARGDRDAARADLAQMRAATPPHATWLLEEIDDALQRLSAREDGTLPASTEAIESYWTEYGGTTRPTVDTWTGLAELAEGWRGAETAATLDAYADTLSGARAGLVRALARLAADDREGLEERLVELGLAPRGDRDLALAAVTSARERGAFARAGALLTRVAEARAPSARRKLATPLGELSERAALEVELGALELSAAGLGPGEVPVQVPVQVAGEGEGEVDPVRAAVLARWRAALADRPDAFLVLTHAAGMDDAAREALATLEAADAARTPRSEAAYLAAAELAAEAGDPHAAFERLLAIEALQPSQPGSERARQVATLARASGRLPEWRDAVLARRAAAPESLPLAYAAVTLTAEVQGWRAALEAALAWPAVGGSSVHFWLDLAQRARMLELESPQLAEAADANRALERELLRRARQGASAWPPDSDAPMRMAHLLALAGDEAAATSLLDELPYEDSLTRARTASAVRGYGHAELALRVLRAGNESERDEWWSLEELACLRTLGLGAEWHARLVAGVLESPGSLSAWAPDSVRRELRAVEAHAPALTAARAAVDATAGAGPGAGPGALHRAERVEALRRLVVLEAIEHVDDPAARVATLAALAEVRPTDELVLGEYADVLSAVGRDADAATFVERSLELIDRLAAAARVDLTGHRAALHELRGRLKLRLGDAPGALAAWCDDLGRRFESREPWHYSLYSLQQFDEPLNDVAKPAWRHGLAAEALASAPLDDEGRRRWYDDDSFDARLRAGAVDEALALAFEALTTGGGAGCERCAHVFGAADRLAELEARLDAWSADASADAASVARTRAAIATQRGDFAAALEAARTARDLAPEDPEAHERVAVAALQASEPVAGLAAAHAARTLRMALSAPNSEDESEVEPVRWTPGGPVRFGYGAAVPVSGSASGRTLQSTVTFGLIPHDDEWATFERHALPRGEDLRAELAHLAGQTVDALRLEAARLARYADDGAGSDLDAAERVASDYARWAHPTLDREAERLLAGANTALDASHATRDERALRPFARRVAVARIADARAKLARRRGDEAAAAVLSAEADAARPFPAPPPSLTERGLAALDAGDAATALALLREAEQEAQLAGRWPSLGPAHAHGLAQARAAVEGPEAARADLLRANSRDATHARAAATRAWLR